MRLRLRLRDRSVIVATIVGFGLRLIWVSFATRPPVRLSDPWHYQRFAVDFAAGSTMTIGGEPTAFYPPGYPMALAPLAWLARHVGIGLPMAASALNVVAGTVTIVVVAWLARRWIDDRAGVVAAWLMAIAPGQIFLTSTSLSETLYTATLLVVVALATGAVDHRWSALGFGGVGVLVGYTAMIRSPGFIVLAAVPLVVRARSGRWRPALRPSLTVAAGTILVLTPWTVRNALQVGVATPTSTNNVAFLCLDNRPGADGLVAGDLEEAERCFRRSPMDDPSLYEPGDGPDGWEFATADEPVWYRTTLRRTVGWIVEHPGSQPGLVRRRVVSTFSADSEALSDAEGFGVVPLVGPGERRLLNAAGNLWLRGVLVVSLAGLLLVRRCRAALPIWGLAGLQVLAALTGPPLHRLHHPIVPFLVVLAAGALSMLATAVAGRPAAEPKLVEAADPMADQVQPTNARRRFRSLTAGRARRRSVAADQPST